MSPPDDLDRLSHAELKGLVVKQWEQMVELQRLVAALREEIARLKGGPRRPNLKPSGMERGTEPKPPSAERKHPRGSTRSKLAIDEERTIKVAAPLRGSRFKGYTSFVVQDLVIRPHVVNCRCERWQTPDGGMVTAPLPVGIDCHFGPELRRFVLAQYHQGQMTVPRLVTLLRGLGIFISKRQVVRLLIERQDGFLTEARDVLRAGLSSAAWITVDDTGARHKAANGFCTQIGNMHFAWFGTTGSKSRLNFLALLRAGYDDYVINAEALAYMRERALAAHVIARLLEHPDRRFAGQEAWNAHLERLGISALKVNPAPVLIASEGALWGSVKAHGFLPDTVIVSDDAGQFDVGQHGLCWVHAERLVHKLDTFTDKNRAAQASVRNLIWNLYRDLKAYRCAPTGQRKAVLRARFDRIFTRKTGFVTLDRLLARLHANKPELLMVLDRPEIPLHTNGSENDIRCHVTRRKVSGGTRSDVGRDCRDAFLGIVKTCAKLEITFWDYLGARLAAPGAPTVPPLPELVLARSRPP
ncbi:MAG TPA: transposase [Pseudolabrys sp.]|nr:transposase [Pseudolabrys sp.]